MLLESEEYVSVTPPRSPRSISGSISYADAAAHAATTHLSAGDQQHPPSPRPTAMTPISSLGGNGNAGTTGTGTGTPAFSGVMPIAAPIAVQKDTKKVSQCWTGLD
jgi:hypothetical protein